MNNGTALLSLVNIEASYGPVKALHGVTMHVRQGRITTVLGANGAGKSTILKTVSGVLDPTFGEVHFDGASITGNEPEHIVRAGISHVPEGREVFPLLSVGDNLLMGAYTRSDHKDVAADIEQVYDYFPILRERCAQPAGLLSGGQQQMLSISRALLAAPRMMLLDEPSLGLSPKLTQQIFEIIVRINRERGVTMLLVEQNANLALEIADDGYVLENGRIVANDTCAVLRQRQDIKDFYLGMHEIGSADRRQSTRRPWL